MQQPALIKEREVVPAVGNRSDSVRHAQPAHIDTQAECEHVESVLDRGTPSFGGRATTFMDNARKSRMLQG